MTLPLCRLSLLAVLLFLVTACDSGQTGDAGLGVDSDDGEGGAASEPSTTDGPQVVPQPSCDPYACDCGLGEMSSGGNGSPETCVGTPLCNSDDECPQPRGGESEPVCSGFGDVVLDGFTGSCRLPCASSTECPAGMECVSSDCQFVTGPAMPRPAGAESAPAVMPAPPVSGGGTGGEPDLPIVSDPGDPPANSSSPTQSVLDAGPPDAGDAGADAGSVLVPAEPCSSPIQLYCGDCNCSACPGESACPEDPQSTQGCICGGDSPSPEPVDPLCVDAGSTDECVEDLCSQCQPEEVCVTHWVASLVDFECQPNPCDTNPLSQGDGLSTECAECAAELCPGALCQATGSTVSCIQRCTAPDTPIATPVGERAIKELREGDLVLSVHRGRLQPVPVLALRRLPVVNHRMTRVTLASGRVLEISQSHPTADGRSFGSLSAGDSLDSVGVIAAELVPYQHPFTYDILPDSDTGTYLAGGALIGSTLFRGSVWVER